MQRLEVSGAVRPLYGSLSFKGLKVWHHPSPLINPHENYTSPVL